MNKTGTHGLEGGDLAGLGRDVVDEDTTVDLGAEVVVELETAENVSIGAVLSSCQRDLLLSSRESEEEEWL